MSISSHLVTIACADDQEPVRALLTQSLAKLGFQIVGAVTDGLQAVELVKKHHPQLIILDLQMPNMDGLEATRQIMALGGTAVMILSTDEDHAKVRKAMELGACGFLNRPFYPQQLATTLECSWFRYQQRIQSQEESRSLREALELRKLVEKAKGILMEQQNFSEDEAHRCLQKMSQDQGLPLQDICRSVIQVRQVLGAVKSKTRRAA